MRVDKDPIAGILHKILQSNEILTPVPYSIWVDALATTLVTKLNEVQEVRERVVAVKAKEQELRQEHVIQIAALEDEMDSIQRACFHYSKMERLTSRDRKIICTTCGAILEQENL